MADLKNLSIDKIIAMLLLSIDQELAAKVIRQFTDDGVDKVTRAMQEQGLTAEPKPVADLLDILKITKQSLARVLRQLVDNGYIEQKTGETDRRQRLLYATAKGRELFDVLSATQTSRIQAAIAALPPEGKRTVLKFFVGMVEPEDRGLLDRLRLTDDL